MKQSNSAVALAGTIHVHVHRGHRSMAAVRASPSQGLRRPFQSLFLLALGLVL